MGCGVREVRIPGAATDERAGVAGKDEEWDEAAAEHAPARRRLLRRVPRVTRPRALVGCVVALYVALVVKDAWLSDDAYITFRSVFNFVNGYGPTWNVDERVQSFTHPLWMFALSGAFFLVRNIYWSSVLLCCAVALAAVCVTAWGIARSAGAAVAGVLVLSASKTFLDFSTSGLEDPATFLLLALFVHTYFRRHESKHYLLALASIAGLGTFNRMDSILLFLPALLYACGEAIWHEARAAECAPGPGQPVAGTRAALLAPLGRAVRHSARPAGRVAGVLALGFAPFIAWEVFSVWYYGFLFPNTAYAKLSTGIPGRAQIQQGLAYLGSTFAFDPLLVVVLLAGLALPFALRRRRSAALALGIAAYTLYVVKVGGDFMAGRFLVPPFFLAVTILVHEPLPWLAQLGPATRRAAVACLWVMGLGYALLVPGSRWLPDGRQPPQVDAHGVADERSFYVQATGLSQVGFAAATPRYPWYEDGLAAHASGQRVVIYPSVGYFGYAAGPSVHIVDRYALCDPLLARLPSSRRDRIGHFTRSIPAGYVETLISGHDDIQDPDLAAYYGKLALITRGNLFDPQRLLTIWQFNTGQYDDLLRAYIQHHPVY